jgi:diguanylate cyclase (GGDEF)-like protein/PAS domain S-box-containing protein
MPKGGWATTHEDVTERRDAPAVVDQRISLQTLIDLLPDYLWVKDAASRFVVVNKAVAGDFGRGNPSDMIGLTDFDIHGPDAATGFWAIEKEILTTGRAMINQEELVLTHSGKRKWNSTTKVPFRSETGEIIGLVAATRDISARKSAEALRDGQAEVLELIASSAPLATTLDRLVRMVESQLDGILGSVMLLDEGGCHLRFGAAPNLAKSYLQAADGMRIGPEAVAFGAAVFRREPVVVADIATDPPWQDYPAAALAHGYRSCWSTPIVSRLGEVLGVFVMYSTSIREPTSIEAGLLGTSVRIAGIAIDRERAEARINFMATHDTLTGLPNRALLEDRLVQALLLAQRYDRWATVAFVDLDNFKVINDTLGHRAGDEVLKVTAARMVGCLRSTDTVVRLGGDEFVVVLSDQSKNSETVSGALQKLRAALTETIDVAGRVLRVTCSIGVANYPNDGRDAETLLANADAAMYRAKELGRDNVQFHMA